MRYRLGRGSVRSVRIEREINDRRACGAKPAARHRIGHLITRAAGQGLRKQRERDYSLKR